MVLIPKTWKRNTAIVSIGLTLVSIAIFNKSAEIEKRAIYPRIWVPSMMWAKQFKEGGCDDPYFQPPKSL
ncbi:hypothetical protein EV175_000855 [Coemansia sp. RSA 1933]|nr:hypothetical protein EV175_000855 [Coemansia sp. RSA 1933]